MDDRDLVPTLRAQFALDWGGIHGIPHWERVRGHGPEHGARAPGAIPR